MEASPNLHPELARLIELTTRRGGSTGLALPRGYMTCTSFKIWRSDPTRKKWIRKYLQGDTRVSKQQNQKVQYGSDFARERETVDVSTGATGHMYIPALPIKEPKFILPIPLSTKNGINITVPIQAHPDSMLTNTDNVIVQIQDDKLQYQDAHGIAVWNRRVAFCDPQMRINVIVAAEHNKKLIGQYEYPEARHVVVYHEGGKVSSESEYKVFCNKWNDSDLNYTRGELYEAAIGMSNAAYNYYQNIARNG